MKKNNKIFIALLTVVVVIASAVMTNFALDWLASGGLGLMMAGGAVIEGGEVDTQLVRDQKTTMEDGRVVLLNSEDIDRKVVIMNPTRTPLDTILREKASSRKAASEIVQFWAVGSEPLYDTPNSSASGDGSSTAAKAYTYASGNGLETFILKPTDINIWAQNDTFYMKDLEIPSSGTVDVVSGGTNVIETIAFYVEKVESGSLIVKPLNGIKGKSALATKYVMPDFTSSTVLYKMGRAENEKAAQTKPFAMIPEPDENYCQNFMAMVEESFFQRATAKQVNWDLTDIEAQNIYALRAKMEMSAIMGVKSNVLNSDLSNRRYTSNGIYRMIDKRLEYGTGGSDRTIDQGTYLDWMESVFVGNNGSNIRYLFGGSTLIKNLHLVETVSRQLKADNTKVEFGLEFNKIVTNFGTLMIYHHPLLSYMGFKDNGLILDLEHVRKNVFQPMQVQKLDLNSAGISRSYANVISECSCVTVMNPDCHAWIGPKVS